MALHETACDKVIINVCMLGTRSSVKPANLTNAQRYTHFTT